MTSCKHGNPDPAYCQGCEIEAMASAHRFSGPVDHDRAKETAKAVAAELRSLATKIEANESYDDIEADEWYRGSASGANFAREEVAAMLRARADELDPPTTTTCTEEH